MPDPVILVSARRHGVANTDMLHAFRNPIRAFDLEGLVMVVGADPSGRLLEVGYTEADDGGVIIHAMPARSKFLR